MGLKITVDLSGITAEAKRSRSFKRLTKEALIESVEAVSITTRDKVKSVMPVDTGFAKALWGIMTPEHIVDHLKLARSDRLGESIWKVTNGGLSIEQGAAITPRNYIELLNAGSSSQAPMMFLDVIAGQAETQLANMAAQAVSEVL